MTNENPGTGTAREAWDQSFDIGKNVQKVLKGFAEEIFRELQPEGGFTDRPSRQPRFELYEQGEDYLALIDLPGVAPEDVEVTYENGELIVEAMRPPAFADATTARRLSGDANAGRLRKAIAIPGRIEAATIGAQLRAGVLRVTLPKKERSVKVKVDVKG